jgi:hypothetical protein
MKLGPLYNFFKKSATSKFLPGSSKKLIDKIVFKFKQEPGSLNQETVTKPSKQKTLGVLHHKRSAQSKRLLGPIIVAGPLPMN